VLVCKSLYFCSVIVLCSADVWRPSGSESIGGALWPTTVVGPSVCGRAVSVNAKRAYMTIISGNKLPTFKRILRDQRRCVKAQRKILCALRKALYVVCFMCMSMDLSCLK